ncbi:MAG: NUDIX domain-containing protein [Anaplasmataceae bacterium]|nr:NUDIX domain-containing protein [Anaplasmataceae bacterium]
MADLSLLSQILSVLTATADIALVGFVVFWILEYFGIHWSFFRDIKVYLIGKALAFSFLIALVSVIGSLFYSNILGYEPCALCWWARVFIYPQAFILALAWPEKNRSIFRYLIPLSVAGALLMIYNQALQLGLIGESSIFCGNGEGVSCAIRFVFDYGFVTIPMMALTSFLWLIVLGILGDKDIKSSLDQTPTNLHEVAITAIIVKNGRYLITRRSATKRRFPNQWTVPGGRLEVGDYKNLPKDTTHHWYNVLEKTLRREVKEEVNLDIKNIEYVTSLAMIDGHAPSLVISCLADYASGEVKLDPDESDSYAWVTLTEAKDYNLIDGIYDELVMAENQIQGRKAEWERTI